MAKDACFNVCHCYQAENNSRHVLCRISRVQYARCLLTVPLSERASCPDIALPLPQFTESRNFARRVFVFECRYSSGHNIYLAGTLHIAIALVDWKVVMCKLKGGQPRLTGLLNP